MKKYLYIIILLFSFTLQAQNSEDALKYLEFIAAQQEDIPKRMWRYTKAIAHSRSDKAVENRREQLVKTIERAYEKIKSTPGYEDDVFKNQVLEMLQFNKDLLNDDYDKIIDMKAVAEQSYDAMEAYMLAQEMADEKMEEVQQTYEVNYMAFAEANNITILEAETTDLGKKMAKSNEVFKYYKEMYLVFFKVQINEIYLMNALNESDVNGIQQNANALTSSAKEGLEVLKAKATYNKDSSIISATQKNFEFYIDEAENKIPVLVDFLILSEDMKKSQETLDKTPKRKRTKEQIDKFNKLVKDYNSSLKAYNRTNAELNRKRNEMINAINEANQNFLSKHIPND